MGSFHDNCEIVELKEDHKSVQHSRVHQLDSVLRGDDKDRKAVLKLECRDSLEDDLNKLFASINLKTSCEGSSPSLRIDAGPSRKNAEKQPLRADSPHSSGIGISEPVTLKQALRGLRISHASQMAAMKRLSKSPGPGWSGVSDAGRIKNFYKSVENEPREAGLLLGEAKEDIVEISLVPEESTSKPSESIPQRLQLPKIKVPSKSETSSPHVTAKIRNLTTSENEVVHASIDAGSRTSKEKVPEKEKTRSIRSPSCSNISDDKMETSSNVPGSSKLASKALAPKTVRKGRLQTASSSSCSTNSNKITKSTKKTQRLAKPVLRNKIIVKKISKENFPSTHSASSNGNNEVDSGLNPIASQLVCQRCQCTLKNASVESYQSYAVSNCQTAEAVGSAIVKPDARKQGLTSNSCYSSRAVCAKSHKNAKPREKGELSLSSKSSLGEYSSSTSISEESNLSRPSFCNRPHMSKDVRWKAIRRNLMKLGVLGLERFNLVKKLGCGDIGTVYLAELIGSNCLFAIKVMDNEYLERRKKLPRAQTEREILRILDHPFLPTLYAHFTSDNLSCLVMDYCPGGDLYVLRQKQFGRSFPEQAARFYAAEVLLALEYLHMLGVVYRDLKPENILVREDGHIMLTDFDLSLRCSVSPTLFKPSLPSEPTKMASGPSRGSSCIDPLCIEPSCQVPCFSPRLLPATAAQVQSLPQLVAEPTSARSNSFVGTHEYLAPEIIKGEGHGSAVDWWTFGIFLYELLYGKTPFKGSGNEETLVNVVRQSLKFPDNPVVSSQARDLIRGLLIKEPENRLGTERGASEIKGHPFFEGMNWALIRCSIPPEIPEDCDFGASSMTPQQKEGKFLEYRATGDHLEFELF